MTALLRWVFCLAWIAGAGLLWLEGVRPAWAGRWHSWLPAVFLLARPSSRRRRGGLQYVQMAKEPVAVP